MSLEEIVMDLFLLKDRIDSLDGKTIRISDQTEVVEKRMIKAIDNKMRRL